MRAPLPPGSVLLCSRNRPELLKDCLRSIERGSNLPHEIIVVDQSDVPDESLQCADAERPVPLKYLWCRVKGLSHAMNLAVSSASTDLLIFTHDDIVVDAGWYGAMIEALAGGTAPTIVTGRVLPSDEAVPGGFVPSIIADTRPQRYSGRVWKDVLYPMSMAMHRGTFLLVGPFEERIDPGTPYPAAEDNDYAFRALERGVAIQYVPGAVVWHRAWHTNALKLRWMYALGQGAFYAKHVNLKDRYMLWRLLLESSRYARECLRHALRLDRRAPAYAASLIGLFTGAVRWRIREARKAMAQQ